MISAIRFRAPCVLRASIRSSSSTHPVTANSMLAMNVYDKAGPENIAARLRLAGKKLLGSDVLPKDLLQSTPKQAEGSESVP